MDLVQYDDAFAAFQAVGEAAMRGGKPILKFNEGDWLLGQDKEEFPKNSLIAINLSDVYHGWVLWVDDRPQERRMVPVASGQKPESRSDLGHHDQMQWKVRTDGSKQDPWQFTFDFEGREIEGEQRELTITGSSFHYRKAAGKLMFEIGQQMRANAGKVPLVSVGNYRGNTQHGLKKLPTLTLVEWRDPDTFVFQDTDIDQPEDEAPTPAKRARF